MSFSNVLSMGAMGVCVFFSGAASAVETLKIGLEASYPPFESKTPSGALTGFDIDVGNALCERMKVKCMWVENTFDGLIPALQARKFDAIDSAMNITMKRRQAIDFTQPVYIVPMQMIARRGSNLQPTVASLKGRRVGVLQGAVQSDYAQKHWANEGVQIVSYQTQDQVYADLAAGRLDASVQEVQTAVDGFFSTPAGKDFDFAGFPLQDTAVFGDGVGIGVRKNDAALKARLDTALGSLKHDGTLSALSQKYFKRDIISK